MGILYEIIYHTKSSRNGAEDVTNRPGTADLIRQSYYRADRKLKENLMLADKGLNKA
ncbi:hypothetical protein [Paenibacillus nasutitermitis]|uniref:Uncharacterized protein n=1 Tax=Paenibacillus nasutitermitis TaxID=1652958 RepID=A0A916YYE2_9BACL|nr:hypothetical protein [Paenibacillus nasutitermitis]GGD66906.1 hypothetical protein GCM10010911_25840 [Paenibacillus nasutitermitis]